MAAYNPKYTAAIIANRTSMKYDVTPAITNLMLRENDGEIAQKVTFTLANVKIDGKYLSDILDVRDRVYVYADDDEKNDEVFRGYIWTGGDKFKQEKTIPIISYDNLIYFQESEDYKYFSSGYSTKSVCSSICSDWGVPLKYTYESITHPKLPLRGNLADIFLTDLLEEVRKKKGKKSVMRSIKDVVHIDSVGSNTTIYKLFSGENGNVMEAGREKTMQGMVTKVVILGKEDDNDRASVEATVKGDVSKYGTLQKILNISSGTSLSEAKTESNEMIKDKGKPKTLYGVTAIDIPWIRKGDKVQVVAGSLNGHYIVTSITHDASSKLMSLEVEDL